MQIGNREFEIKQITLGQWQQLCDIEIDAEALETEIKKQYDNEVIVFKNYKKLLTSPSIFKFIAIILFEKDKDLSKKNIHELEQFLKFNLLPEQIGGIVTDFLALNPPEILNQDLTTAIAKIHMILKIV